MFEIKSYTPITNESFLMRFQKFQPVKETLAFIADPLNVKVD